MNEQLELDMSKKWCTGGCNQLLTDEEFKTHECFVRDRSEKKSRGIFFAERTTEQIRIDRAEDAAIEREKIRTLNEESSRRLLAAGTDGERIAALLAGSPPESERAQNPQPKEATYQDDADFDLYQELDTRVVRWFRDHFLGIRVDCPEYKAGVWTSFRKASDIAEPPEFAFLPPALDPAGEKRSLSGWVKVRLAESQTELTEGEKQLLDTINVSIEPGKDPVPYSSKIRIIKLRKHVVGYFGDVKLALTLLCADRAAFKISSEHHINRRRGPRKPKEIKVVADAEVDL